MNEILTIREVSDYLRLSRTTVWRWCNEGKLLAFKVGRGWRVRKSDVDKLISQPDVSPTPMGVETMHDQVVTPRTHEA
jgi:excisionase family DNA binding protein